jgi:FdhD protein
LNASSQKPAIKWDKATDQSAEYDLLGEEPLSIRVDGEPYAVVMRTPGDELAHAAGFCLAEGLVDTPDDIATLSCCEGADRNTVTVTLSRARRNSIDDLLNRRGFISQTSCGLCGKQIVKDLQQMIRPFSDNIQIDSYLALKCLENLWRYQPLRAKTRASHAAALYSADFELLATAEDAGRHNAIDKAVGKLFLDRRLDRAMLGVLSSRISYELVQKAARAGIPIIFAVSRPTSLAVELAAGLNMTLACLADKSGLLIFCNEQRLKRQVKLPALTGGGSDLRQGFATGSVPVKS